MTTDSDYEYVKIGGIMAYNEASFYFISGTGNSYRVGTWLDTAVKEAGVDSAIYSIDRGYKASSPTNGAKGLIGIIFPTHGFTAPWPVIRFALYLPASKRTHAIVIPTRAGVKIGPVFFPGMQGTAGYLIALILLLKGYDIRGVIGVDMPSNWTALHWGLSSSNCQGIISRAKVKTMGFVKTIISGKRYFKGLIELLLGLMLFPLSLAYLIMGHIFLAKLLFSSDTCNGCGICAKNCPVGAIRMIRQKPYWTYKCESCMRCMNFCPAKAVEASYPLAVGMYFITGIPVSEYLLNIIDNAIPVLSRLNNGVTVFLLQYIYFLISVCVTYFIFFSLNRSRVINMIFKIFTPTHYYKRYHEPDTKLSDLIVRRK